MRTHDFSQPQWGHSVEWAVVPGDSTRLKITGWGMGVRDGDYLILRSGSRTTRYLVETVRYLGDPDDMFLAEAVFAPRSGVAA